MFDTLQNPGYGYTPVAQEGGMNAFMRMDAGYLRLAPGQTYALGSERMETAALLLSGSVVFAWGGERVEASRPNSFDAMPWCLHLPRGAKAEVAASGEAELLVAQAENGGAFTPRLYRPEGCADVKAGAGEWQGTARRDIRTVFDYESAPHSNLVVGEVVNYPGRWSSCPPHHHPQPELYFYRFDRPQGFGVCFVGSAAHTVKHLSYAAIPGGLVHPQASAPGYAMHYVWVIRHLEGNPWTKTRTVLSDHEWLLEADAAIRSPKD